MAVPYRKTWLATLFDRERSRWLSDWLAVALVAALPWSTSAVGILSALWLAAVLPSLRVTDVRRVLATPAGGLPVVLCAIALIGMVWAFDITLADRWDGLRAFLKLLFIPLLMAHFSRSERGPWVIVGFLVSCGVLLTLSWALVLVPGFATIWPFGRQVGMPVRDYIAQSSELTVCIFLLFKLALDDWRMDRRGRAAIWLALAALSFINILYVSSGRTVLVVIPVLLVLFVVLYLSWRSAIAVVIGAVLVGVIAVALAPPAVTRLIEAGTDLRDYRSDGRESGGTFRLDFWRKAIGFVVKAPVIGHGTGSIREQYRKSTVNQTGLSAHESSNPHNQTLAVAIQLGLVGTAVMFAMWLAHLMMFRSRELVAWVGLLVVVPNIVGSLFNSHLFNSAHGWGYVLGFGIAAGMMLKGAPKHLSGAQVSGAQARS